MYLNLLLEKIFVQYGIKILARLVNSFDKVVRLIRVCKVQLFFFFVYKLLRQKVCGSYLIKQYLKPYKILPTI